MLQYVDLPPFPLKSLICQPLSVSVQAVACECATLTHSFPSFNGSQSFFVQWGRPFPVRNGHEVAKFFTCGDAGRSSSYDFLVLLPSTNVEVLNFLTKFNLSHNQLLPRVCPQLVEKAKIGPKNVMATILAISDSKHFASLRISNRNQSYTSNFPHASVLGTRVGFELRRLLVKLCLGAQVCNCMHSLSPLPVEGTGSIKILEEWFFL